MSDWTLYDPNDSGGNSNTDESGNWWDLSGGNTMQRVTGGATTPFEMALQRMGYSLWGATDPFRQAQSNRLLSILNGSYDITQDPMYQQSFSLGKQAIDSQLSNAMDQIIGTSTRGGTMNTNLENLATQAMVQQANLPSMIAGDLLRDSMNQANQVAWGTPMSAIQALTGANQNYTDRLNQESQNNQQDENNAWDFFGSLF